MWKPAVCALIVTLAATQAVGQTPAARDAGSASRPEKAADLSGQWQGLIGKLRTVLKVSTTAAGGYRASLYFPDQTPSPTPIDSLAVSGSTVRFTASDLAGLFDGELAPDGQSIKGTFTQRGPTPLELVRATAATAWVTDTSPHTIQFVTTNDHVQLEVLDWGGTGRPLVFIPGLGADAHVFDTFAQRFTAKYHVYGISRRGYGASDRPDPTVAGNYMADRLGDDVLTVLDTLKLDRPVLAGWSLGGEEMSSIASRKPDRISALIYLDAAYAYSFYSPGNMVPPGANLTIDLNAIRAKIDRAQASDLSAADAASILDTALTQDLPLLQTDLQTERDELGKNPAWRPPAAPPTASTLSSRVAAAINNGMQRYPALHVPVLAIFALPHRQAPNLSQGQRAALAAQDALSEVAAKLYEAGNPNAKVVRIPNADHAVFASDPDQVEREMEIFLAKLN